MVLEPYTLTQTNHCGERADTLLVTFQALPALFDLGPDTVLCPGETLLLTAPQSADALAWQDGSSAGTYLADQAGTYVLTLSNPCGMSTDELTLAYDHHFLQLPIEDVYAICPEEVLILDITQPFEATYAWSTGATLPAITVTTPGVYAVTAYTACMEATGEFTVTSKPDCSPSNEFFIPNVISPNGDNINDIFAFHTQVDILSIDGSIFDRWGNLVFSSSTIPFTWDGKVGGEDVNPGVFVYTIVVTYVENAKEIRKRFTGDVTVMK